MLDTGTSTAALLDLERRYISPSTRIPFFPLVVEGGTGVHFTDVEGRRFLDFHSMACILNVGHNHPRVVAAIETQARKLVHANSAYTLHEPMLRLAERLAGLMPGEAAWRVAFGLSGSDANDGALKLVRAATGRPRVIAYQGAYHGNTYGALSLSAITPRMRLGFFPDVPGIHHVPFPGSPGHAGSPDNGTDHCLRELERTLATLAPASEVAAVLIEPIQGDAGIVVPPPAYLEGLRDICARHGMLIVAEEVQTGIGRTGNWLASEWLGLQPDVVILGKALGSGLPVSAVVARAELMDSWEAPGHVFCTAANPVCCAAALATLDVMEDEDLLSRCRRTGARLADGLEALAARHDAIAEIRGAGLMLGVDLQQPDAPEHVGRELAARVVAACFTERLYLTFLRGSVLRLAPPLIVQDHEIDRALEVLDVALARATSGDVSDAEVAAIQGW